MVNVKEVYVSTSDYLKADDLEGEELTLTIKNWKTEPFKNDAGVEQAKVVLSFKEIDKTLVCNKTNAGSIAYAYGDDTDDWIGKTITLFPQMADYQGRTVPAIRVRATKPKTPGAVNKLLKTTKTDKDLDDEIPF